MAKEVKRTRELQGQFVPLGEEYLVQIKATFKEDGEVVLTKSAQSKAKDIDEVQKILVSFAEKYHEDYTE